MAGPRPTVDAPTLRSARTVIRPIDEPDFPALEAVVREPSVAVWWPLAPGESVRDELGTDGVVAFAIVIDGVVAGMIMYTEETSPSYYSASIDLMLGSAYQDRGLGTEALRTVVRYLISRRGHHRITIDPAVANERAIRVYEKVGFKPVGVMRSYEKGPDGTWRDNLLMDLLAGEFIDG